jgi:hypothetical protein
VADRSHLELLRRVLVRLVVRVVDHTMLVMVHRGVVLTQATSTAYAGDADNASAQSAESDNAYAHDDEDGRQSEGWTSKH